MQWREALDEARAAREESALRKLAAAVQAAAAELHARLGHQLDSALDNRAAAAERAAAHVHGQAPHRHRRRSRAAGGLMALLSIAEPGQSQAPHQHRLAIGIDLGTTNSLVAAVRDGSATVVLPR
jgi:hypothetical protein